MEPIGPLMKEHRLIERMIGLIRREGQRAAEGAANPRFVRDAVNFMRTYADRCHHGKEEDILFRALTERNLEQQHMEIMDRLVKDHAHARKLTKELADANERYADGEQGALAVIRDRLNELAEIYPAHIDAEDNHFFRPCMNYFSEDERRGMLERFIEFDRKLIHETYGKIVERYET